MKKIIVTIFLVALLSGCSLKSPYIGQNSFNASRVSYLYGGICTIVKTYFTFQLAIDKGKAKNGYVVNGTAQYTGAGVYNRQMSGNFNLLLVRNKKVVDDIPFLLRGGIKEKDNLFIEFSTEEEFDAVTIYYNIMVGDT